MVYKKYTAKKGKLYGPYLYKSKRVGDKVVTTYIGRDTGKEFKFLGIYFTIFVLLILLLIGSIIHFSQLTGRMTLDVEPSYIKGEQIKGNLKLNLAVGELIPKDARVSVSLGEQKKEISLSELVDYNYASGNFYVNNSQITGAGEGYGIAGEKEIFPEIKFALLISNSKDFGVVNETSVNEIPVNETSMNEIPVNETPVKEETKEISKEKINGSEKAQEKSESTGESSSSSSSDADSSYSFAPVTGATVGENENIVNGKVSKDKEFNYALAEGENASVVSGSVKYNESEIGDENIQLEQESGKVKVKTRYSVIEKGFGEEFMQKDKNSSSLVISLDKFNISAIESAKLKISLVYEGKEIVSAEEDINVEDSEKILVNETILNQTEINKTTLNETTITIDLNASKRLDLSNVTIITSRHKIKVGAPVKWIKNVSLIESREIDIELPKEAENISVRKIDASGEEKEAMIMVQGITGSIISGRVSAEINLEKERGFFGWLRGLFSKITGRAITDVNATLIVSSANQSAIIITLLDNATNYILEYYTQKPGIYEKNISSGKIVIVSGPDSLNYTNVIASTATISKLTASSVGRTKIYWRNYNYISPTKLKKIGEVKELEVVKEEKDGKDKNTLNEGNADIINNNAQNIILDEEGNHYVKEEIAFTYSDYDNDSFVDLIHWVVPHLSNQTFEIIEIVKAEHLDSNRTFIEDVYEQVKARDNNWTEIPDKDYLRVTFEQNLTAEKDITFYARASKGSPIVNVYEKDNNTLLGSFGIINLNQSYRLILTNLTRSQRTFDLQIDGGNVDFDYVVDPIRDSNKKDIISKRTIDSKHYANPDGTYTAEIYSAPIFYKNESGQWDDINTSLEISTDPNYDYMNIKNNYKTYLSKDSLKGDYNVKYEKGDASIELKTISKIKRASMTYDTASLKNRLSNKIKTKLPDIKSNKLKYPETYNFSEKTMNIEYEILDNKLHEEFILNAPQNYPEIEQEIKLNNAYAKQVGDEILIYNKITDEYLWTIPRPVMFEKNNQFNKNYGLHYEFSDLSKGTFTIKKVLDKEGEDWLASSERVYPLVVDTDFAGISSTYVYGSHATSYSTARSTSNWMGFQENLYVGQSANDYAVKRSFLKFNTISIGFENTITQVNLILTILGDDSNTDFDVQIVKYDWSASDPITNDNRETAYDGCLAAALDDNIWRNTAGITWDGTYTSGNLATSWVNKTGNTYYGLRSNRDTDSTTPTQSEFVNFHLHTDATPSYRPTLSVTYTLPDTCTYSSGNWNVNCKDNCTITSNVNMGGNSVIIKGTGKFIVNGVNISNYGKVHIEGNSSTALCNVRTFNGGRFKK